MRQPDELTARSPSPSKDPAPSAPTQHAVQFYESDDFLSTVVADFAATGLRQHEAVVLVATPEHRQLFTERLRALSIDVGEAAREGTLLFVDAQETLKELMHQGLPQWERFRGGVATLLDRGRKVAASGRVRAYGEMVDLLWRAGDAHSALLLEGHWNRFATEQPFTLLCAYGVGGFHNDVHGSGLAAVCHEHSHVTPTEPGCGAMVDTRMREINLLQQRARALESEIQHRKELEEALRHTLFELRANQELVTLVAGASEVLSSSLDYETTLHNVVRLAIPVLGDFGYFDYVEGPDSVRRIAYAQEDARRQALLDPTRWERVDAGGANTCALSSGKSALYPNIDDAWLRQSVTSPAQQKLFSELAVRSMLTVPLAYQGAALGALTLFFADSGRRHSHEDLAFAEELARRAAASVENARLYRRLEEAVARQEEADRRKDEFLAMLGHELRNPLAPILTALQLMELHGDERSRRERNVIQRQAQHLTRLVDDLLDISRVTRGKAELKRERLELWLVINKAIETASPLLEQRNHRLDVHVPRTGLCVEADPVRLSQVFSNLLTNAAKYTEPGGHISVTATAEGDERVVRVEDNGCGLPPELLPTVFNLFVQGDRTLDRAQGGLGLGLALVRSLTELHRGTVSAHSDGPGKGSRFEVRLPAAAENAQPQAPTPAATLPARRRLRKSPERVLIVDDNSDAADLLGEALRDVGYEVRVVHDGPSALSVANEFQPQAALLDIGLPVMDGYELARRLREQLAGRPLRLVAVTGYGQERDKAHSERAGFDVHLVKPIELAAVLRTLEGEPVGAAALAAEPSRA
jgi:signal transduction histidine kinase/ActR/RegA family two-component response regulator